MATVNRLVMRDLIPRVWKRNREIMSLDVYLKLLDVKVPRTGSGIFVRENGATVEISAEEWNRRNPDREPVRCRYDDEETDRVYHANITHNLGRMADHAGMLYEYLWHPDRNGVTHAVQLIEPLRTALATLQSEPELYKRFNPKNGWGTYEQLVRFVADYLTACESHPEAVVEVSA